jgi:hypothetical protein
MKYLFILIALSACAPTLQDHLQAEQEFHAQLLDPEYVDDCLYYEDLICEFEQ